MARPQRLKPPPEGPPRAAPLASRLDAVVIGGLAASLLAVSHFPGDSVAVERGDALWFSALALGIATAVSLRRVALPATGGWCPGRDRPWAEALVDGTPALIAFWIGIAALATSPPGNLRMATNEAWFWVAWALVFPMARHRLRHPDARAGTVAWLGVVGGVLAVHALHQEWISFPRTLAEFEADPARVLRDAGIDAPPGSAERMTFENRLRDGGPTATFALANSLAGVMVAGVLAALVSLAADRKSMSAGRRAGWLVALVLTGAGLLLTRSRSGVAAVAVGVVVALVLLFLRADSRSAVRRWVSVACWSVLGVGITLISIAAWGNPEWREQAPTSLAFRFQYWRSTWDLVSDRPWFGAGPGNFQSIYERYREPAAHEQIADPHHFWFETLAAGGFPAGGMLLIWLAAVALLAWRRSMAPRRSLSPGGFDAAKPAGVNAAKTAAADGRWLSGGAVIGWVGVWVLGLLLGDFPDAEAHLFAIPAGIVLALAVVPRPPAADGGPRAGVDGERGSDDVAGLAATVAALGMFVHLCASGGWTVPGVAVPLWLLAAIAATAPETGAGLGRVGAGLGRAGENGDETGPSGGDGSRDRPSPVRDSRGGGIARFGTPAGWLGLAACSALLAALYLTAIRPTQRAKLALIRAEIAFESGRQAATQRHLEDALRADPWAADASLWLADSLRYRLVRGPDRPELRRPWEEALAETLRRAGDDPAMARRLGEQRLHLYQRHGRLEDLRQAHALFRDGVRWSPSHQGLAAQAAVTAEALGDDELAQALAEKARRLAGLGSSWTRRLELQLVLKAEPLGRSVVDAPARMPASELLRDRLVDR